MEKLKENAYDKNSELIKKYREGDSAAGRELAILNRPLVYSIASRFLYRHGDIEELCEIGNMGLVKAINCFNLTRGCAFSTYAVPLIFGEIRRFLRDDGIIKVSRENKKLSARLLAERDRREQNGESTRICDIAKSVGVTVEEASVALFSSYPVRSLDECIFEDGDSDTLGDSVFDEWEQERTFDKIALKMAIEGLTPLRQKIVALRYYKDLSQEQTARVLGITQVKVSREECKILQILKKQLT